MNTTKEILNWPCKTCGILNRFHEAFLLKPMYYEKQIQLYDGPKLVPKSEHYADPPLTNLQYIEYLYDKRTTK